MRKALLAASLAAAASLGLLQCKRVGPDDPSRLAGVGGGTPPPAGTADSRTDVVQYARHCKAELGITVPLPAMSCLAGEDVPITVDGAAVTAATWDAFVRGGKRCDKPQWLERACYTYDLAQTVQIQDGIEAVLNCRQKYFPDARPHLAGMNGGKTKAERLADLRGVLQSPTATAAEKEAAFRFAFEFNDLGLVLRNATTGKTCYFTVFANVFFGGWLPPPDADASRLPDDDRYEADLERFLGADFRDLARHEYVKRPYRKLPASEVYHDPETTAGGGCVSCHETGSFKWSPFMEQAGVLPDIGATKGARGGPGLPFLPVGQAFIDSYRQADLLEIDTTTDGARGHTCTSCHRIVSKKKGADGRRGCSDELLWATGEITYPPLLDVMSERAQAYPDRAWMRPSHGKRTAAAYEESYGAALRKLKCCCEAPGARGCKSRKFGPTAAEVETAWTIGDDAAVDCTR